MPLESNAGAAYACGRLFFFATPKCEVRSASSTQNIDEGDPFPMPTPGNDWWAASLKLSFESSIFDATAAVVCRRALNLPGVMFASCPPFSHEGKTLCALPPLDSDEQSRFVQCLRSPTVGFYPIAMGRPIGETANG